MAVVDGEWRIRYLNEPAAQMLGRPHGELLGSHIWTGFPETASKGRREPGRRRDWSRTTRRWSDGSKPACCPSRTNSRCSPRSPDSAAAR
ncbi:MAG: hypothetical protein H0X42_10820 [Solirubrobacterales bacterium]|nr:hypothetical protein [Solirubrobacterales bacterium]